jgi:uncharacterized protein
MMSHEERRNLETKPRFMIFGASTRAAAQSAVRAGFRPLCADCFVDEDLKEVADVLPLDDYPNGLLATVANSPPLPWIYTGALENRPALIEKLASLRPLWGNPADVLSAVRNPFRLFETLKAARLPALAVRECDSPPPPAEGRWLLKPLAGAAGRGIQIWQPGALPVEQIGEPCYFQERHTGKPISALFLATRNGAALIGVSDQLIGLPALSAEPFAYCGSIGPIPLAESTKRQIAQTGDAVASTFGLRGLFGIDLLLDQGTGVAWPTEVNPRYTASVEIYEWVSGLPLLKWHIRACQADESSSASRRLVEEFQLELETVRLERPTRQAAKVIVYAPFSLHAPDLTEVARLHGFESQSIEIADRPGPGIPITAKSPVCTLIAKEVGPKGVAVFERCLSALAHEFERNRSPE